MAMPVRRVVLTYADYLQLPDDLNRYEILDGELAVNPAPSTRHQRVLRNLALVLISYVDAHALGEVLWAPCDVYLSDIRITQPDLLFVAREHLDRVELQRVNGPPDLVVEILSPGTAPTDRNAKFRIYASSGIPSYWLVDPVTQTFEAYVLGDDEYALEASGKDDETVAASPFLDLPITLTKLWE